MVLPSCYVCCLLQLYKTLFRSLKCPGQLNFWPVSNFLGNQLF
jgi:hypothetical protein